MMPLEPRGDQVILYFGGVMLPGCPTTTTITTPEKHNLF